MISLCMFLYCCMFMSKTRLNIMSLIRLEPWGALVGISRAQRECMHRLSPGIKKSFMFLQQCMIMYGIAQVYRQDSRLTTGPGDLKSIWILVPVAVRFPGCYNTVPADSLKQSDSARSFSLGVGQRQRERDHSFFHRFPRWRSISVSTDLRFDAAGDWHIGHGGDRYFSLPYVWMCLLLETLMLHFPSCLRD